MSDRPRLLFVTPHAFNHVTGGGVAFTNLFRGWPKDRLATVHNDAVPTEDDVCSRYYRFGLAELDLVEPFASLRRGARANGTTMPGNFLSEATEATFSLRSAVKRLAIGVLGDGLPQRARLTPALERWIADFKPELLYTILGTNGMMELVEAVWRRFDLPLVVHIMDDWPASAHRSGLLAPRERRLMEAHLKSLFGAASECLAISDAMAEAYTARYGRPFKAIQNAVEVARWKGLGKSNLKVARPAELLYVGSIFPNAQLDSLVDCAAAVASLARTGYPIRLSISTPTVLDAATRARLALDRSIRIEGAIRDDAGFYARIAAADVLLVPVNFDDRSVRFIRYSMPAKLPAYMLSGTPILVYGSPETAQVRYARGAGWGHVVDRRDGNALADGLRAILEDTALRARLHATAQATAARFHDAAQVSAVFQSVLAHAARAEQEVVPV